ncbi:MAG: preprotein translocase subunit YajC [Ruminococcaceae bacterium]|nr:preprotein translocase subunit YajC [Oscillospiraceae bacterium]
MDLIVYGVMIVAMVLIFVFMNRKQKKQDQEIKNMRDAIRIGDEITTIGGIIGRVVSVKEDTVVIETSRDGTKIRFLKSAISRVDVTAEDAAAATKDTEAK